MTNTANISSVQKQANQVDQALVAVQKHRAATQPSVQDQFTTEAHGNSSPAKDPSRDPSKDPSKDPMGSAYAQAPKEANQPPYKPLGELLLLAENAILKSTNGLISNSIDLNKDLLTDYVNQWNSYITNLKTAGDKEAWGYMSAGWASLGGAVASSALMGVGAVKELRIGNQLDKLDNENLANLSDNPEITAEQVENPAGNNANQLNENQPLVEEDQNNNIEAEGLFENNDYNGAQNNRNPLEEVANNDEHVDEQNNLDLDLRDPANEVPARNREVEKAAYEAEKERLQRQHTRWNGQTISVTAQGISQLGSGTGSVAQGFLKLQSTEAQAKQYTADKTKQIDEMMWQELRQLQQRIISSLDQTQSEMNQMYSQYISSQSA